MIIYKVMHAYLIKTKMSTHKFRHKPDNNRIATQARFPSHPGTTTMLRTKLQFQKINT